MSNQIVVNVDDNVMVFTPDAIAQMYEEKVANTEKIELLEKKLKDKEVMYTYLNDEKNKLNNEIEQAHTLLNALKIQEKNEAENSWSQYRLPLVTRLALFLSTK